MLPEKTYFVCTTPRSGSTLLCETLGLTGLAGRPKEYFEALRGTDTPRQPRQYFDDIAPDIEALLPLTDQEPAPELAAARTYEDYLDRKSTRLNSSHANISYAVFCLKKKTLDVALLSSA